MTRAESRQLGLRKSAVLALPTAAVGLTFGVLAAPLLGPVATVAMSLLVWSGTAQFAAITALGAGAGTGVAVITGLLANTRFLPLGFAIAPSLRSPVLARAATGAALTDASFVIAHTGGGRFDITALRWAFPFQYGAWAAGTVAGVLTTDLIGDPRTLGLDVLFGVFYLSLLLPELTTRRAQLVAVLSAGVTLAAVPVAPAGLPVLIASAAALIGLRKTTA